MSRLAGCTRIIHSLRSYFFSGSMDLQGVPARCRRRLRIRPGLREEGRVCFENLYRTGEMKAGASLSEIERIDCVYLWVDGDDPAFRRRLKGAGGGDGDPDSVAYRRFRDNGELKFSLRSLERNAPWIGRVYVVHQEGLPSWLDTSNPRLRTIRHEEIFPDPSVLPIFNSCAIELNLHRIPGLSRRFLYFNDDLFLGRELTRETFISSKDGQRFFFEPNPIPRWACKGRVHDRAYAHTSKLVDRLTAGRGSCFSTQAYAPRGRGWRRCCPLPPRKLLPAHVPQLYNRDRLFELEALLPEAFDETRSHRFRSPRDLVLRILYAFFFLDRGEIEPVLLDWNSSEYLFVSLGPSILRMKSVFDRLADCEPLFLCVNDDLEDVSGDHPVFVLWRRSMEERYPLASSFEKKNKDFRGAAHG